MRVQEGYQQTRDIDPMLVRRWASVVDGGPLLARCIVFAGIRFKIDLFYVYLYPACRNYMAPRFYRAFCGLC